MSKEPVYIKEVSITDYKSFRGENRFSFYDSDGQWCRWTVFLGNNNTGKTNLLKAIAAMEPEANRQTDNNQYNSYFMRPSGVISFDNSPAEFNILMAQGSSTASLKAKISNVITRWISMASMLADVRFFGYGVVRELESPQTYSNEIGQTENAANLLNNIKLTHFESWLLQLVLSTKNAEGETKEKAEKQLALLKDVLTGDIFPEISDVRFVTDDKLNNYVEYRAEGVWLKFSSLGYGYQSALSWIADFCKKMFNKYPDSPNPLKEPAVLLIDEIDLHLHPHWQRTIVSHLSAIFPKTQFIVTTHSPFVIQSMEKVNLYTLRHANQTTTVKHYGNDSFVGWGIEEILSEVMELDDNIKTDRYQELMSSFDAALDANDYRAAKDACTKLSQILHPSSEEHTLLKIRLSQLAPEDD
jgi:predicted ATP-binding protein involved in virulence